jgi:erythromycin esterase
VATQAADELIEAYIGFDAYLMALAARAATKPPLPGRDALDRLQRAADRLTDLFDHHASAFGDQRRRGFLARTVVSTAGFAANLYERYSSADGESRAAELVQSNRRDSINAQNLRWLIEEGHRGKKIIVWAHNAHVMNAYYVSDWKTISLDPVASSMKPTGVYLADWLGQDLYSIGCTAFAGEDGWVGSKPKSIAAALEGGVEERIHRLGMPYAFLDLRQARGVAGHPLRQPQTIRVPKYDDVKIADATRPYDALFYAERMQGATLIR